MQTLKVVSAIGFNYNIELSNNNMEILQYTNTYCVIIGNIHVNSNSGYFPI